MYPALSVPDILVAPKIPKMGQVTVFELILHFFLPCISMPSLKFLAYFVHKILGVPKL